MYVLENTKMHVGKNVTRYTFTCADGQYITRSGINAIKRIRPQHIYKSIVDMDGFKITIPNNYNPLPEIKNIFNNPKYVKVGA